MGNNLEVVVAVVGHTETSFELRIADRISGISAYTSTVATTCRRVTRKRDILSGQPCLRLQTVPEAHIYDVSTVSIILAREAYSFWFVCLRSKLMELV